MQKNLSPSSFSLSLLFGLLSIFSVLLISFLLPVLLRFKIYETDNIDGGMKIILTQRLV